MVQEIFIIGATGKVGTTLVHQIFEKDVDRGLHKNPTRIVGLASSSCYIFDPKGLPKEKCHEFIGKKGKFTSYENLEEILELVKRRGYGAEQKLVYVDVTASKDILKFHISLIDETKFAIVTANKNPLVQCDYATFRQLIQNISSYGYRCSVMAGAEAVSLLQDLEDVGDTVYSISGCFSGTLGFICSELEQGKRLSEIIKLAHVNGFTEPHPRDDLNGVDVARKLLILARTAGHDVSMDDIQLVPFIPEKYLNEDDVATFIDSTRDLDEIFEQKVAKAKERKKVLRYVAILNNLQGKVSLTVSLQEVPKESALGSLTGTANKITVISNTYNPENPYIVEAPGAGLQVTAQNIRRDLLYKLEDRKVV